MSTSTHTPTAAKMTQFTCMSRLEITHAGRRRVLQRLQPVSDRFQRLDNRGGRVLIEADVPAS